MRTIKIGRDPSSQVFLDHEMISRHHAILRVYSTGKMELVSMGVNGTKLNGALVRPNVVYKVKRSDMISFADRFQLDWNQIYNPRKKFYVAGTILLVCLLLFVLVMLGKVVFRYFNPNDESAPATLRTSVEIESSPEETAPLELPKEDAQIAPKKDETNDKTIGFSKNDFFPKSEETKDKDKNKKELKSDSIVAPTKEKQKIGNSSSSNDSVGIKSKVII